MNAASLHMSAALPAVAAHPATVSGGGIAPAAGQGFVPAGGSSAAGAAPQAQQAQAQQGAAPADAKPAPTPEQVLQSLVQILGDEFGSPIVAADGTIYMERKKPDVSGGTLQLSYLVVGKLDKTTGKLQPSPEALAIIQEKSKQAEGGKRVLVKVGDQMVWQTFAKDENGKDIVTEVQPATDEEVAAYQQQQAAAAAQQQQQAGLQNRADWQRKVGTVAQNLGLFGSIGQFSQALANGGTMIAGRPSATWISGYILAQRLNGKSEYKLLPEWFSRGPVATALEIGLQAYGMLDMGRDIRNLRQFFGKVDPLPAVNPKAVEQLVSKGMHVAEAQALAQLGSEMRQGTMQSIEGSANAALLNTKLGAVQLAPKDAIQKAMRATDPLVDKGLDAKSAIDGGINKGFGLLGKLIQPAMMGATVLGFVSNAINIKNQVATQGMKSLLDTQQGRGAILGATTSAAYLGMYLLPMALPALGVAMPAVAAASSAINIAQNVLGGVQLLNSHGLFGGDKGKGGFLDNDAVRAAFLVPPLTPIGAFAFWMKSRQKKKDAEAAQLQAAQKLAVERVTQQREMVKLQLQSTGQVAGAVRGKDGTIKVSTNVPNDLEQLAAQMGGRASAPAAASGEESEDSDQQNQALAQQRRQLAMVARPM